MKNLDAHTKGKLIVQSGAIYLDNGQTDKDGLPMICLAHMDREERHTRPVERDNNAKRLVACWNACDGLNPDMIPKAIKLLCQIHGNTDKMLDAILAE